MTEQMYIDEYRKGLTYDAKALKIVALLLCNIINSKFITLKIR